MPSGQILDLTVEKIFIRLLDGSTCWAPMDALKLSNNRYKLLESPEYSDYEEFPDHIYEFWPGDIVELVEHEFTSGQRGMVGGRLVENGNWPDRKLREFKFKATLELLTPDKRAAEFYETEIRRVKNEIAKGWFTYQPVLDYIRIFDTLSELDGRAST